MNQVAPRVRNVIEDAGDEVTGVEAEGRLPINLSDHWDPFAVADAPVEQIRAEYGIPSLELA